MVKRLSSFLLCLMVLFSSCTLAEQVSRLSIETDTSQVEMGKYLIVKLVYTGQQIPQPAQLHSWKQDFYIEEMSLDTEHLPQNYIKTVQTLRLYPRSTGNKTLHAIAQGGAIARPIAIKVVPLVRNNINGTPRWMSLPTEVWQGETIRISVSLKLMSENNQVKTEEARFPGFYVIKSGQKKIFENGIPVIQVYWLLQAQNYGVFKLAAPSIIQRGRGRWRFYLPERSITIKPLPAYIPATVPVTSLNVMTELKIHKHQPVWELAVQGRGILPQEIYGLKRKLAALGRTTPDKVIVTSTEQTSNDGFIATQIYRLEVPPWSMGFDTNLLNLDFFDPKKGQLKQISVNLPGAWFIPSPWKYLVMILLVVALGVACFYLFRLIKLVLQKRAFIKAIRASKSADQLRHLILHKSADRTLTEWASKLNNKHTTTVTKWLNEMCFAGKSTHKLEDVKTLIIKYYRHRL